MEKNFLEIMYDLYVTEDIITVLENLTYSTFAPKILNFIYILSMRYKNDQNGRFDILIEIYNQFIKKKLINKLRSSILFDDIYKLL